VVVPTPDHRVEIQRTHHTSAGSRYRVIFRGETLLETTRDPEFEACRVLLARGVKGTLASYWAGSSVHSMIVDIEKGATLAAIENDKDGPRIGRYRRHPNSTEDDDAD